MSGYVPVPPLMPGSSPQMQAPPMAASIQAQTASPNPILREIHSLSPGAKQALQQAHSQSMPLSTPAQPPSVLGSNPPSHIPQMQHPDASSQAPMMNPDPQGSLRPGGTTPPAPMLPPGGQQVNAPSPVDAAESRTEGLISHPSGISQIHNPVGRVAAGIGAELGHIVVPGIMSHVPGTEDYRQHNIQQSAAETGLLQKERGADTQNGLQEAQTGETQAKTGLTGQQASLVGEQAQAFPQEQEAKEKLQDAQITNLLHPQAKTDFEAWRQQNPTAPVEAWLKANGAPAREQQLQIHGDNLAQQRELREESMRQSGEFHREHEQDLAESRAQRAQEFGAKQNKPTADEQKKADLVDNLNENLGVVEQILKRRPELFGPLAGRFTEMKAKFGTSDPDIAALEAAQHQLGMVQQGVHGMRSAQGMQGAVDAIMNGFHNSPQAMQSSIDTVRNSAKTFTNAVGEKGQPGIGGIPGGGETIRARDPQGKLHEAPAGTPLPQGWKKE